MMIGTSCNEKNCPGALGVMLIGLVMFVTVMFGFVTNANAEVVVTFNRDLPLKSYEFTRTFEDKDSFEMWLAMRLEDEGCDPYLSKIVINFNN